MTTRIFEIREKIRSFYGKYGAGVNYASKFLLAVLIFYYITSVIGYSQTLTRWPVILLLSIFCAVIPSGAIPLVAGIVVLIQFYFVSLEVMLTTAVIFIILLLIYIVFMPENGVVIVLVPLLFSLNIPYLLPLVLGLAGSIGSIVPLIYGVIVYYLIQYVSGAAVVLSDTGSLGKIERYIQLINGLKDNMMIYGVIIAFCLALLITLLIKNLSIAYAPYLAILSGVMVQILVFLLFNLIITGMETTTVPVFKMFSGCILSGILVYIYQFIVLAVDYKRTEYVQFEDDDYYYYVKAVPKLGVTRSDLQVKKIVKRNGEKKKRKDAQSEEQEE